MSTNKEIWLLTDYRGAFYSTIRNCLGRCSFDLQLLKAEFNKLGFVVHILPYSELDLRRHTFKERLVLYQSAEDPGLRYKDYLEDLLLGIQLQGGILIPPFQFFRAHHNKVFLEVLRDISRRIELERPQSRCFGTLQDFQKWRGDFPKVFKKSWGAGSSGVRLARDPTQALKVARAFSRSAGWLEIVKEYGRRLLRREKGYVPFSLHRNKFIVQDFIPGLSNDYKVLVYWDKYYVLVRKNRPGDFRASGSGLFSWPDDPPPPLLDYASRIFSHFDVPVLSMDIGIGDGTPFLLECQFVSFGPLSMEKSQWHFRGSEGKWVRVRGESVPEVEYARSVANYLEAKALAAQGGAEMRNGGGEYLAMRRSG